ncbi:MAG: zinc ribbon domain-containing protein [Dehalococcoidales bacterium]|nr:zinc ribbon domain-containing protein [Dehalococcoidales bacterium]
MPLYEYVCSQCGCRFELIRPITRANEEAPCPRCRHESERILSRFSSFSKDSSGLSTPVGGSSCTSCSTASCDSCSL